MSISIINEQITFKIVFLSSVLDENDKKNIRRW